MKGSIKRNAQTGKWDFVFDIGKDSLTGKRKQIKRRGFKTKRLAAEEMTKLKAEILSDNFLDLTLMTYARYMDEWFIERQSHLQKTTFEIHLIYYRNLIKPKLGHFKIQQLSPLHIQKFINELVNQNSYSEHTIHLTYRIISASLKKAKIIKLLKDNPASGITLPKIRKKEMNVWSLEQVNHFINKSKKQNV